jgi:FixJ family two-component response regulator
MQEALARTAQHRPIVFMSGYSDIPTAVQATHAGAVALLAKPFPGQLLLAAIADARARP